MSGVAESAIDLAAESWRADLVSYAMRVSDGAWLPYKHAVALCDILQTAIMKGNARVIVNMPPRHGKSEVCSTWLPAWFIDLDPTNQVILSSYSGSLAADFGYKVRDIIRDNPEAQAVVRKDKDAATNWITTEGGGMKTAGSFGTILGRGGDLIVIDDPHKNWMEANNKMLRRKIFDNFLSVHYTRREPNASIVVVMHRLHEQDFTGMLLEEHDDDWIVVNMPAIAGKDDAIGRAPGEALCPERYDVPALLKTKKALKSARIWSAMFDQDPSSAEGNTIKRIWLKRYSQLPDPMKCTWTQSWDLTFEQDGTSWVVGLLWAQHGANHYLVDQFRDRIGFTDQLRVLVRYGIRHGGYPSEWHRAPRKLIEKKANGHAAINLLTGKVPGIIAVNPVGSKLERLEACSPLFEAGNIFLPTEEIAPWVIEYIEEIVTYPNSRNDDRVDTTSQYLNTCAGAGIDFLEQMNKAMEAMGA